METSERATEKAQHSQRRGQTQLVAPDGSIHAKLDHATSFGGTKSRYYAKTTTQSGGRYKDFYDFRRSDPRRAMVQETWEQFPGVLTDIKLPRVVRQTNGTFSTYHRKGSIDMAHDTK
jgi:hypothetical protein